MTCYKRVILFDSKVKKACFVTEQPSDPKRHPSQTEIGKLAQDFSSRFGISNFDLLVGYITEDQARRSRDEWLGDLMIWTVAQASATSTMIFDLEPHATFRSLCG